MTERGADDGAPIQGDPTAVTALTVSVVVPSYRRPDDLVRCLTALGRQDLPADEVMVVHRPDDERTRAVAEQFADLVRRVEVTEPGQLAALQAGAAASTGAVIAFTDDDAAPRSDWCRRLRVAFSVDDVGAVGGRDVVHHAGGCVEGSERRVGVITNLGRVVGYHHVGAGPQRDVDHLKGVNMAVRRRCLTFAVGLRGSGAQVGNDLATSLAVRTAGQRVVYDPTILVDHYPAERFDEDGRETRSVGARADAAFNQSYIVFSLRPDVRWRRLLFVVVWGDRDSGGAARRAIGLLRRETELRGTFVPLLRAQCQAWILARRRSLVLVPLETS